ncbi:hypothetical protein EGW08_022885 [Elysia chlorotica]|uniref:RING finger protein 17 n=1 Tax=Elysia chlorotica TaxID=188477 RepID=A0A433SJZ8_ELYCH|nr:hypothetical protein EGW08_022885 [Elysia chlorotica]
MKPKICSGCNLPYTTYHTRVSTSRNGSSRLPLLLKCGHTFCESCLSLKIVPKKGLQGQHIICSTCKAYTPLQNGIKDLQANLYLLGQLGVGERSKLQLNLGEFVPEASSKRLSTKVDKEIFVRKCKICDTFKNLCKCLECDSIMCCDCFEKFHRVSAAIRQHKPVPLISNKNETQSASPTCEEHGRLIEYHCTDDNTAICSRCYIIGSHKNHSIISFEEKNKELLNDIEIESETAQRVIHLLDKSDEKIAVFVPQCEHEIKKVVETMSDSFLHLHTLLQVREMEIIDSLTQIFKEIKNNLEEKRESFCVNKMELEAAVRSARMLIENNALVIDSAALLENLKAAKTMPCHVVKKSQTESSLSLKWDETCKEDLVKSMQSFGSILGDALDNMAFLSLDNVPPDLEDQDNDDRISVTSSVSTCDRKKVNRLSSIISSSDGVIIENSDADSDISRSGNSKKNSSSEVAKQPFQETLILPVVKGKAQKVSVTHICSPNDFLVQLSSNKRKLETLSHNINTWCRRDASIKYIPINIEVGDFVLARYSVDKTWYRARVLGLGADNTESKNNSKVHVQYMDYGNEEFVPLKELRSMEKRFMLYPVFTVRCCLRDIAPYDEQKPWSPDTIAEFQKMTENQVLLLSTFAEQSQIYEVDLLYIPNENVLDDGYVSVRDTLVFLELARFKTHSDAAKHMPTPSSYKKVDFIKPTVMKSGITVDVIVTSVESPSKLHIVCKGDEHVYYLNMQEEMQEIYSKDSLNIYSLYYPRLNMVCSVLAKDDFWYRAKVISAPKHGQVTVSLVDVGSNLIVGCDHLKKLHSKFVKLPAQAIYCSLADISPVTGASCKWSAEAKLWSKKTLNEASGLARIKSWGEPAEIVLWLGSKMSAPASHSINFLLVEMGCAISTGLSSVGATQESLYDSSILPKPSSRGSEGQSTAKKMRSNRVNNRTVHVSNDQNHASFKSGASSETDTTHKSASDKDFKSPSKKNMMADCGGDSKLKSPKKTKNQLQDTSKSEQTSSREKERVQKEIHRAMSSDSAGDSNFNSIYIEVIISSYESPSDFVLRVRDKENQLKTLMRDMQEEYKDSSASPDANWKLGEFCAVKHPDDKLWYRGKILSCDPYYLVEMVDFGFKKIVDYLDIRLLARPLGEFMECAAVRCHIANLVPAGSGDPTKWSRTASEFMKTETKDRRLFIKQEGDVNDQGLPIDIIVETEIPETAFDPAVRMYHSLRQAILDKGLAMPTKKGPQTLSPVVDASEPFQRVIFEKKTGVYQTDAEPVNALTNENLPMPETIEAVVANGAETEFSSAGLEFEAQSSSNGETAMMESFVLPMYPLLTVNEPSEVFPTYVDHSGVIYVQPKEWEDMVIHLDYELQRVYSSVSHVPNKQWEAEQVCVAYYPTDDRWYRAVIKETQDYEVEVHYIDYGNTETVKTSYLREMLPEFGKIHPLALYCKLHDIVPNTLDNKWPTPVLEYMHELMVNAWCGMNIVKVEENGLLQVELTKTNGLDLGCHLVEQGMASRISDLSSEYDKSRLITQVLSEHSSFPTLEVGGCGDIFQATLTHVELPNLIYMQRVRIADTDELDFVKSEEIARINNMIDEFEYMTQRLNSCKSMPLSQLPGVGFMCAAKYSYDDVWYRALVIDSYKSKGSSLIFYVDFGTSEVVPMDNLRILPSEFWSLPAQAIRIFFNIVPPSGPNGFWKRDSINGVVQALACKEIVVKITQTSPLTGELLTVGEDGDTRLAYESVIEAGLALLPKSFENMGIQDDDDDDVVVEGIEQEQAVIDDETSEFTEQQLNLEDSGSNARVDWWGTDTSKEERGNGKDLYEEKTAEETGEHEAFSSSDGWTTDEEEDKDSDGTVVQAITDNT